MTHIQGHVRPLYRAERDLYSDFFPNSEILDGIGIAGDALSLSEGQPDFQMAYTATSDLSQWERSQLFAEDFSEGLIFLSDPIFQDLSRERQATPDEPTFGLESTGTPLFGLAATPRYATQFLEELIHYNQDKIGVLDSGASEISQTPNKAQASIWPRFFDTDVASSGSDAVFSLEPEFRAFGAGQVL